MNELIRTNSANTDFITLVRKLDAYLAVTDGDEHDFYDQFNKLGALNHVVLVYENGAAVACGAIKEFEPGVMEVKRMYTEPQFRGQGIARSVLNELEQWAVELGCSKCVLETGKRQYEAVNFYKNAGYGVTPNYGQYIGVANSICFAKQLIT